MASYWAFLIKSLATARAASGRKKYAAHPFWNRYDAQYRCKWSNRRTMNQLLRLLVFSDIDACNDHMIRQP